MNRTRLIELLDGEINRHISLALTATEPVLIRSHLEVAQALVQAELLVEGRSKPWPISVWAPAIALCRQQVCRTKQSTLHRTGIKR